MKATVVIPTYDERDDVQLLVNEIPALSSLSGVTIVDNNSPDGTGNLVDAPETAYRSLFSLDHGRALRLLV